MKRPRSLWFGILGASILHSFAGDVVVQENWAQPINDLALSDDGRFVVTLGMRGQLSVWDTSSGALLESLERQPLGLGTALEFAPDNRHIHYCCKGQALVWDWLHRRLIWSSSEGALVSAVAVDPRRNKFYVAGKADISQRSLSDGKELARFQPRDASLRRISVSDKGDIVALCDKTGILFVDHVSGETRRHLDLNYPVKSYFSPETIARNPQEFPT